MFYKIKALLENYESIGKYGAMTFPLSVVFVWVMWIFFKIELGGYLSEVFFQKSQSA